MKDLNEAFVHLNVGLPDDVERLKAAGYYKEAMARIDEYLAEDWTETQNSPRSQGLEMPEYEQPANPVPHGVDALRDALLVQKEIMRRLPQEYCWNEAQAVARMLREALPEKEVQVFHAQFLMPDRAAQEQVMRSLRYAYIGRKLRKRDFRSLWIARINAAARMCGTNYSRLINGLKLAGVDVNRKVLADLAVNDAAAFAKLVETAKAAL